MRQQLDHLGCLLAVVRLAVSRSEAVVPLNSLVAFQRLCRIVGTLLGDVQLGDCQYVLERRDNDDLRPTMKLVTSMSFCGVETLNTPLRAESSTGTVRLWHCIAEAVEMTAAAAAMEDFIFAGVCKDGL